uniref:Uncharacterized protein n=1 Tax=Rhizophora mucronata TaxID=61149 RepID=A0A2P2QTG3_RHIMU
MQRHVAFSMLIVQQVHQQSHLQDLLTCFNSIIGNCSNKLLV